MIRSFIEDVSSDLSARRAHWTSRVRRRAWRARAEGRTAAWQLGVTSLTRLHDLVEHAPMDLGLEGLLAVRLERATEPGIEEYDERTAKELGKVVRDIQDPVVLARIARYEAAHKARKTVLGAVEKQQARIVPEVVPMPAPSDDSAEAAAPA